MTDPIADLLTRIRNGLQARKESVVVPHSILKEDLLKILKMTGYVSNFIVEKKSPQSEIIVTLRYFGGQKPVIHSIRRVSRPGGRQYRGYKELNKFNRSLGVAILSTPKGVMTSRDATRLKVGGEVLCEVW